MGISKQLVPVYDKPMIYYPLSTLMLAGIRDILVITTPHDADQFQRLLGDGSQFGINITYTQQPSPDGLAQAFVLGAEHIGDGPVALVLGDNIFYGQGLGTQLRRFEDIDGGAVFGYRVQDPSAYGVVEFDASGKAISLEEKPENRKATTQCRACTFTTTMWFKSHAISSHLPAANWKLRTSTASTWNEENCTWKSCPAELPGWTPEPSTTSMTPQISFAPCRNARASPSGVPRRLPGVWDSSVMMNCGNGPHRSRRVATGNTYSIW